VPAAVHGYLRTIDHFFSPVLLFLLQASACRRLFVISPKKAHPAADRQGAKDIISGNLKKARGRVFFYHFYPYSNIDREIIAAPSIILEMGYRL
jgi:hypothetical protein